MIDGNKELMDIFAKRYLINKNTVLDIGGGSGVSSLFMDYGAVLTIIDLYPKNVPGATVIKGSFPETQPNSKFDCVWCSHTLEHSLNVNVFLRSLIACGNNDCVYGIIVPPPTWNFAGGHVSVFTPANLCYNIILAGQDLSNATVIRFKYNTAVFWRRSNCNIPILETNKKDIELIGNLFPRTVTQGVSGLEGWDRIRADDFVFQ